jgi:Family of unknown function (DUF5684)
MMTISALALQSDSSNAMGGFLAAMSGMMLLFWLAVAVIFIIGMWKVFTKAGQPGWASIIPFYNIYILLKIAGRPGWWLLLFFIPLVNFVIAIILAIDVAKAFGQSAVFGIVLLFLLSGIGYLVLGFGNYRYVGPATATRAAPATA